MGIPHADVEVERWIYQPDPGSDAFKLQNHTSMSAEGLHALNTSYPVRSLAERETTVAYFVKRELPTEILTLSRCHDYEGGWTPEREPLLVTLGRAGGSRPEIGSMEKLPKVWLTPKRKSLGSKYHWNESRCLHGRNPSEATSPRRLAANDFIKIGLDDRCMTCHELFSAR